MADGLSSDVANARQSTDQAKRPGERAYSGLPYAKAMNGLRKDKGAKMRRDVWPSGEFTRRSLPSEMRAGRHVYVDEGGEDENHSREDILARDWTVLTTCSPEDLDLSPDEMPEDLKPKPADADNAPRTETTKPRKPAGQ